MVCSVCGKTEYLMRRYDCKFYCLVCYERLKLIWILKNLTQKKGKKLDFESTKGLLSIVQEQLDVIDRLSDPKNADGQEDFLFNVTQIHSWIEIIKEFLVIVIKNFK